MLGDQAGYYYRPGRTNVWVVYLQGGGGCQSETECDGWSKSKETRGSSANWQAEEVGEKVQDPDPEKNPVFYDAHHVWVPYCTGDNHFGQVSVIDSVSAEWGSYYFDRHLNLKAILAHLQEEQPAMANMERMLFYGHSAGAKGVMHNCDFVASEMEQKFGAQVSCAPSAGWFVPGFAEDNDDPEAPVTPFPQWNVGQLAPDAESDPYAPYKPYYPENCVAAHPAKPWHCRSVTIIYPTVKAPVFVMQDQFDKSQVENHGQLSDADLNTCRGQEYLVYYGKAMLRSTDMIVNHPLNKQGDGLWLRSCRDHAGGGAGEFNGVTKYTALDAWFTGDSSIPNVIIEDSPTGLPSGECKTVTPLCDGNGPVTPVTDPGTDTSCQAALSSLCARRSSEECLECAAKKRKELFDAGCEQEAAAQFCRR